MIKRSAGKEGSSGWSDSCYKYLFWGATFSMAVGTKYPIVINIAIMITRGGFLETASVKDNYMDRNYNYITMYFSDSVVLFFRNYFRTNK